LLSPYEYYYRDYFYIFKRLGELLESIPNQEPIRTAEGSFKGTLGKLPVGINKKESF